MRGQSAGYDACRDGQHGLVVGRGSAAIKRCEDHHAGISDFHGSGSEWRVERQRLSWKLLDDFRSAPAQAGIASIWDFNQGDNAGCDYFEVN